MSNNPEHTPPGGPPKPPVWLPSAIGIVVAVILAGVFLLFWGGAPSEDEDGAPEEQTPAEEVSLPAGEPGPEPEPAPLIMDDVLPTVIVAETAAASPTESREELDHVREEASIHLTGRVYDRTTGEPLPATGVGLVGIVVPPDEHGSWERVPHLHHPEPQVLVVGGDGTFRQQLDLSVEFPEHGRAEMMFVVNPAGAETYAGTARAFPEPGREDLWFGISLPFENRTLHLDVPMEPGVKLPGLVLAPDGRTPAEGVSVETSVSSGTGPEYRKGTETDAEGRFALELPAGSIGSVVARGDAGAAERGVRLAAGRDHEEIVLILTAHGSVSGRVVDPAGGAAPRARVEALSRTRQSGNVKTAGEADALGRFEMARVPAGVVELRALPPEDLTARAFPGETMELELSAGEARTGIVLELHGPESIPVRVESREGEPIPGATVSAHLVSESREIAGQPRAEVQGETDEEGRYLIEGVPHDGWASYITVRHPDYETSTRSHVFSVYGEQVFRLERQHEQEIVVLWAEDRSPVTAYRYSLMRREWTTYVTDFTRVTERLDGEPVRSASGRTTLGTLVPADWRVEVVPLDASGNPTADRGAAEFTITRAGGRPTPVEVLVGAEYRIQGTVVIAETGEPASDALVQVASSLQWDPIALMAAPHRAGGSESHDAHTDAAGRFEVVLQRPGVYTLTAAKGPLRSRRGVDVRVESPDEPGSAEIVIEPASALYGQVIGEDGEPAAGLEIRHTAPNINYTNWPTTLHHTDEEGNYRIEGLAGGPHTLQILPAPATGGESASRDMDLDSGEERRIDFDFHSRIRVHGDVHMTTPLTHAHTPSVIIFHPGAEGNKANAAVIRGEPMTYEVRLAPGTYRVSTQLHYNYAEGEGQLVEVPPTPGEQRHDIVLDFVEADIVLVFPTDEDMEPGMVVIAPQERFERYGFIRERMNRVPRASVLLMGGTYQATFTSEDAAWRGESGWVQIGQEHESMFLLEMKRVQRNIRIGGWDPSTATLHPTAHRFDVTEHIRSPGTVSILVEYERGNNAAVTLWGTLHENGHEVASDHHEGWSGYEKWNNTYRFHLDQYDPAATYHVEVGLRTDGGTDSHGSIYLSTN